MPSIWTHFCIPFLNSFWFQLTVQSVAFSIDCLKCTSERTLDDFQECVQQALSRSRGMQVQVPRKDEGGGALLVALNTLHMLLLAQIPCR